MLVVVVLISFFGIRFLLNELSNLMYSSNIYSPTLLKPLYILNFNQPYIVYYNHGNYQYMNNEYDLAIESYKSSLERRPPKHRVCDIRVNLALATIQNISSNDKNDILKQLNLAKSYLFEDDCAHENDSNGSSEDAEELKEEISDMENNVGDGDDSNNNQDNNENNSEKQNESVESSIEEELRKNNKDALGNRQEDLDSYQNFSNYEYYSGKRW